jgi:hypothetical protein
MASFTDVRSPPLEGLDSHSERFQVGVAGRRCLAGWQVLLCGDVGSALKPTYSACQHTQHATAG